MKNSKRGFTLIELLVVVLIIGILAAVAVPQYQKAVVKSRAATLLTLARNLVEALDVYYLANDKYPADLGELDISLPPELEPIEGEPLRFSYGTDFMLNTGNGVTPASDGVVRIYYCPRSNTSHELCLSKRELQIAFIGNYYGNMSQRGNKNCVVYDNSSVAKAICSMLSGFTYEGK